MLNAMMRRRATVEGSDEGGTREDKQSRQRGKSNRICVGEMRRDHT